MAPLALAGTGGQQAFALELEQAFAFEIQLDVLRPIAEPTMTGGQLFVTPHYAMGACRNADDEVEDEPGRMYHVVDTGTIHYAACLVPFALRAFTAQGRHGNEWARADER